MSGRSSDFLKGLLLGGLFGAIAGILYAPKSGEETREDIGRKAEEIMAKANELTERGKESFQNNKGRLKKAIDAGIEAFKEEKEKVS